jgi:3',5'-cyclic AMP phosphodiesterase CpdA
MENKQFVIAHLSDLHLTAAEHQGRGRARVLDYLNGANEAFKKIIKSQPICEADLIIVTGDVTDRGDIESWKLFWKEVKEAGISNKIFVVPGNHDVCCLGARLPFKKKVHRQRDLEKAGIGLQMGNQATQFPWFREFNKHVVVFGLNSNNLGNITYLSNAMGRIGHSQLLSFAEQLYIHRNTPVKIVVLHHGPSIIDKNEKKRGRKLMGKLMLTGRKIPRRQQRHLLLLCLSHGVRVIAHGHVHKAEDRVVDGVRIVGAPSTTKPASKAGGKNVYQFYTYTIQGADARVSTKLHKVVA